MPEKIGPYKVVSQLGRGGMGVVYKGRDEALNRFVAIKVLTENLTEDPTFLQRFVREAQAAAALSHPNVVQIYFTGQDDDGHPYFVMEFVPGQSLDQMLRSEGRIDNPRASQLMLQAAHGLAAAHDLGIIHRDIKPANLMLDERGTLKIADFGLALPPDAESRLTASGMMVGTPGYLSPEQCAGENPDHRTDIYALGVTYYMLLTGTPPFRGQSPLALMKQILDANPPDVTTINPNVDPESRRILAKMIAREREQRYQNCHELVADLESLLASMGVRSMTAGLATRAGAASPTVAAASTQAVTAPAAMPAGAAPTMVVPRDVPAPTMSERSAVTMPELPLAAAPTMPAMPAMPAPQVKKGASSPAILIAALLAVLLLGGGAIAAVMYGTNLFRGKDTETKLAATAQPAPAPARAEANLAAPTAQDTLLSQPHTPADPQGSPGATDAVVNTVPPPAAVQQQASAQPVQQQRAQAVTPERQPAPAAVVPPARAPKQRGLSGVAIAAIGDQPLLGAVASVLRDEAGGAGLEAVDANSLPSTEDLVQGRAPLRDLIAQLRDDGYAVLMLARIEPTGSRELSYYGRRDTAYTSRITVTAYDLATGRPFGTPQTESITYTSINMDSESQDVVAPLARAVARAIRDR
ncbi:MAG TPA: serine/threonine-protein kinase [Thermoanaerobaculia bacterium]